MRVIERRFDPLTFAYYEKRELEGNTDIHVLTRTFYRDGRPIDQLITEAWHTKTGEFWVRRG